MLIIKSVELNSSSESDSDSENDSESKTLAEVRLSLSSIRNSRDGLRRPLMDLTNEDDTDKAALN